jgi:hypothetical protein
MKSFIENLNTVLGTVCLVVAVYGLVTDNYIMSCAYSLIFIAFQQQTEEKK